MVQPLRAVSGVDPLTTQVDGNTKTGYGLFAAVSFDDGATWPVRRLVTPTEPQPAQGTDGGKIMLDAAHAELNGYLASCQGPDGRIHLISSRNYYVFNLAWLTEARPSRWLNLNRAWTLMTEITPYLFRCRPDNGNCHCT